MEEEIDYDWDIHDTFECYGLNDVIVDGISRYGMYTDGTTGERRAIEVWPKTHNEYDDIGVLNAEFQKSSWVRFLSLIKSFENIQCSECVRIQSELKYLGHKHQDNPESGNPQTVLIFIACFFIVVFFDIKHPLALLEYIVFINYKLKGYR